MTTEERRELERLCRLFPRLGALRQQRETLRQIFEDHRLQTAEGGQRRLRDWIVQARQLGLDALNAFRQTLENWLDKIANYFINRSTNGPTEGFIEPCIVNEPPLVRQLYCRTQKGVAVQLPPQH